MATKPGEVTPTQPTEPTTPVVSTTPTVPATPAVPVEPVIPTEPTPTVPPATPPTEPTVPTTPTISEEAATKLREDISKEVSETVTQEVSKGLLQKIGEAFGLSKKEEEDLPKDSEALKKMVSQTIQAEFKQRDTDLDKTYSETEKDHQGRIDGIVKGWHSQYESLARSGKVPKIANAQDKNDEGVVARRKMILSIGQMINQNKQQGIDYTPTVGDVLINNPAVLTGPPGADLPISGSTTAAEEEAMPAYGELHEKSFEEIAGDA